MEAVADSYLVYVILGPYSKIFTPKLGSITVTYISDQ